LAKVILEKGDIVRTLQGHVGLVVNDEEEMVFHSPASKAGRYTIGMSIIIPTDELISKQDLEKLDDFVKTAINAVMVYMGIEPPFK
jgi:hypothetical protein